MRSQQQESRWRTLRTERIGASMAKPQRPGAGNSKKKGAQKGTGGHSRKALEGRGPTPKAEDRAWHPAGKRKAAQERFAAAGGKGRAPGSGDRRPAGQSRSSGS